MKAVPSLGYLYLFSDQLDVSPMILFLEEPRCHIPKVLGAWSICLSVCTLHLGGLLSFPRDSLVISHSSGLQGWSDEDLSLIFPPGWTW